MEDSIMTSSDDEGEAFPDAVSDYYFFDKDRQPVPFSNLPVQWNGSESSSADAGFIFLGSSVDNGLRMFSQQVKAWKFDMLTTIPEISVLSNNNHWIKLRKPRKSYETLIRSILISVHCLSFCKSKPEASGKPLWDYLSKVFSLYKTKPSENDLLDHINFIREATMRDETLAKSKFLAALLENPRKRNYFDEDVTKPSFIVASDGEDDHLATDNGVSDYYFVNKDHEPVPFSNLPVQWNGSESSSADARAIFLGGTVDDGLRKFFQQVKAWKFDILTTIPEISVLYKDNNWIKLKKPRKSYEPLIKSILISVHCLCFCKSKPEAPGKPLLDYLSKVFSLYKTKPTENDLLDHINFIREATMRDETLAKSKFLAAFLENPKKRNYFDEDVLKPSFIVDSDGEDDHLDTVCAICDNGGKLACCEGKCFRSFHAFPDAEEAQEANCESLCLTAKEVESLKRRQFKCENCEHSLHQCFVCAELGSSNESSNTEVFRCSSATCAHFYHPKCVAKLLQENDKTEQETLEGKIAAGEPFICPAHKCAVCKLTENEKVEDLQFAFCRRCPKSYHRKCLPRGIMFDYQAGDDDEIRAWDGLMFKSRVLIYCLEHEIEPELGTPARTTIVRNVLIRYTER